MPSKLTPLDTGLWPATPADVQSRVERAVSEAKDAVKADKSLDYQAAVRLYEASATSIEEAVEALIRLANNYKERAARLREVRCF